MPAPVNRRPRGRVGGLPRKLTDEQRVKVKELYRTGKHSYRELSEMFSVSITTIQNCINNQYQGVI